MNDRRKLTGHQVNQANEQIEIAVADEPGSGGAHHHYLLSYDTPPHQGGRFTYSIGFQNGPIAEVGVNGLTHEALLTVLIDRLECFQKGKFANDYNARALEHLQYARETLLDRTRDRMAQGIEGTHAVGTESAGAFDKEHPAA